MKRATVKTQRPLWQRRYSAVECAAIAVDFRRGGHGRFITLWQDGTALQAPLPSPGRGERQ
jgi:hypothetical protein